MGTIAIIPARGGSKGIPRKNLHLLLGKPLISYVITAALRASKIQRVIVSTDDPEIEQVSLSYGAEVVKRPKEISCDTSSSEEALLHTLDFLHAQENILPELFVFLQCTSPLTHSEDIDGTVHRLIEQKADSVLSVVPSHSFLWKSTSTGEAIGINHDKRIRLRRQDLVPEFRENGAIYAMRTSGFLREKHRFFGKTLMYVMPEERSIDIDHLKDFQLCEIFLSSSV